SAGHRPGPTRPSPREHCLGHRRRLRLGGHRGGAAGGTGHGLRHRTGRDRLPADQGQRPDLRRPERDGDTRHRPRRVRRAARPAPRAIFVGGASHEVAGLLEAAFAALLPGGRLVVNVATLEALSATYNILKKLAGPVQVMLINVARGTEQLETLRFEAVNPT